MLDDLNPSKTQPFKGIFDRADSRVTKITSTGMSSIGGESWVMYLLVTFELNSVQFHYIFYYNYIHFSFPTLVIGDARWEQEDSQKV